MAEQKEAARRQIDPIFKQVVTDELTPLTKALQTEVEVSRLPRTIDALITLATDEEVQRVRTETPFFYFSTYNQVEFKGREDPLTIAGSHLISGRTQLYLGEQDDGRHFNIHFAQRLGVHGQRYWAGIGSCDEYGRGLERARSREADPSCQEQLQGVTQGC